MAARIYVGNAVTLRTLPICSGDWSFCFRLSSDRGLRFIVTNIVIFNHYAPKNCSVRSIPSAHRETLDQFVERLYLHDLQNANTASLSEYAHPEVAHDYTFILSRLLKVVLHITVSPQFFD